MIHLGAYEWGVISGGSGVIVGDMIFAFISGWRSKRRRSESGIFPVNPHPLGPCFICGARSIARFSYGRPGKNILSLTACEEHIEAVREYVVTRATEGK